MSHNHRKTSFAQGLLEGRLSQEHNEDTFFENDAINRRYLRLKAETAETEKRAKQSSRTTSSNYELLSS